jgi:hypothetical protein
MKLSDKLAKVDDVFEVTKYDNGYKVEVRGEDKNGDWATAQVLVMNDGDVKTLWDEYDLMEMRA